MSSVRVSRNAPWFGFVLTLLCCCHHGTSSEAKSANSSTSLLIRNARLPGGSSVEVLIQDGIIAEVGSEILAEAEETIDAKGRYLVPAVIDSHVHLDYLPVAQELVEGGIAAAIDLAAPLPLRSAPPGLDLLGSGPMLAAKGGYPTRSWGRDGYGIEVESEDSIRAALLQLHSAGARLVKLSLGAGPDLSDEMLRYAIDQAHELGLKVAVHALGDADAAKAARLGADILAHTPTQPMAASTVELWSTRAVVSTLAAFGNAPSTAQNLLALQRAGAIVLYGTDLGNTQEAGISCSEIAAMQQAGMGNTEILAAMTSVPAKYFGLSSLGEVTQGKKARLLLLDQDPSENARALCTPWTVLSDSTVVNDSTVVSDK